MNNKTSIDLVSLEKNRRALIFIDKLESEKLIIRSANNRENISLLSFDNSGKERTVELNENNLANNIKYLEKN